jgi:hypothetical protein
MIGIVIFSDTPGRGWQAGFAGDPAAATDPLFARQIFCVFLLQPPLNELNWPTNLINNCEF